MLQKTLFDVPIWIKEVDDFDYKKGKLEEELSKLPELRNETNTFLSNRDAQRDGLSKSFGNIMSKELIELYENINHR